MQLNEIIVNWRLFKRGSEEEKAVMHTRAAICDTCPSKLQLSENGQQLIGRENIAGSVFFCKLCGCSLENRIHNMEFTCPKGKWGPVDI